jgi:hypothetical protein
MANTAQDEIYRSFLDASQRQSADVAASGQSLADLILQGDQVRQELAQQSAGASTKSRATSGSSNASSQTSSGGGVLDDVLGVFKSGLGLSPLVQGIFSLFGGGGDSETPPPLVKYALPASIDFQATEVGGQIATTDYDQTGRARPYRYGTASPEPQATASPQITVNVSAMDARSFLDRSGDIAAAVREAMLNSNSINDVVSEL